MLYVTSFYEMDNLAMSWIYNISCYQWFPLSISYYASTIHEFCTFCILALETDAHGFSLWEFFVPVNQFQHNLSNAELCHWEHCSFSAGTRAAWETDALSQWFRSKELAQPFFFFKVPFFFFLTEILGKYSASLTKKHMGFLSLFKVSISSTHSFLHSLLFCWFYSERFNF